MTKKLLSTFIAGSLFACASTIAAQTTQVPLETGTALPPELVSTTQILDTSIPFVIGAREAAQTLRASFGWETFQEGFVEGVYFRFDPDGYARFSISPRLDEDVFEIICQGSANSCVAKKDTLSLSLSPEGQLILSLSSAQPNDVLVLSDKTSELPLPASTIGPLDPRLETLLSTGGELIAKRNIEPIASISLKGFSAVTTYLRWINAGQNMAALPAGWPVPAQSASPALQTNPNGTAWRNQPTNQALMPSFQDQAALLNSGLSGPPSGNGVFQNNIGASQQVGTTTQQTFGQPLLPPQASNQAATARIQALEAELAKMKHVNAPLRETTQPVQAARNLIPANETMHEDQLHLAKQEHLDRAFLRMDDTSRDIQAQFETLNRQLIAVQLELETLTDALRVQSINPLHQPVAQSNPSPPATISSAPSSNTRQTELLLKTLLNRHSEISSQDAQPSGPNTNTKALIDEILGELDPQQSNQAPDAAIPSAPLEVGQDDGNDGYVPLSEYLNSILRSE